MLCILIYGSVSSTFVVLLLFYMCIVHSTLICCEGIFHSLFLRSSAKIFSPSPTHSSFFWCLTNFHGSVSFQVLSESTLFFCLLRLDSLFFMFHLPFDWQINLIIIQGVMAYRKYQYNIEEEKNLKPWTLLENQVVWKDTLIQNISYLKPQKWWSFQ